MSTTTNTERIIYSIELDELVRRIADEVERRMRGKKPSEMGTSTNGGADELLTREQAAQLLGITLPTLRDYTRRGYVTGYRIGTRVRYKRKEVMDGLEKMTYARHLKP